LTESFSGGKMKQIKKIYFSIILFLLSLFGITFQACGGVVKYGPGPYDPVNKYGPGPVISSSSLSSSSHSSQSSCSSSSEE
jgi:hypothetical protein